MNKGIQLDLWEDMPEDEERPVIYQCFICGEHHTDDCVIWPTEEENQDDKV